MIGSRIPVLLVLGSCATEPESVPVPEPLPFEGAPESVSTRRDAVPVYGGTMETDGNTIVIADPEYDEIIFVDAQDGSVRNRVTLDDHTEPFRVDIHEERAFLTLRGTGRVASLALDGRDLQTTPVCAEPRGVDAVADAVFVACASGELVELDGSLEVIRRVRVATDLRDVVVDDDRVWVSTFRTAKVLSLGRDGLTIEGSYAPQLQRTEALDQEALLGWRMRGLDEGVVVLHNGATTDRIELEEPVEPDPNGPIFPPTPGSTPPAYGSALDVPNGEVGPMISSTHFTRVTAAGEVFTGGPLQSTGDRYDFVLAGDDVFIAHAGLGRDGGRVFQPRGQGGVTRTSLDRATQHPAMVETSAVFFVLDGTPTSIALVGDTPWVYLRHPEALTNGLDETLIHDPYVSLGFDLFHEVQSTGISCATCHPEGQDDGHVWRFRRLGRRRTQNIAGGVGDRAPFHCDGEFETLDDLMHDVFSTRMGGPEVSPSTSDRLEGWMNDLPPLRGPTQDPALVEEGRALFESPEVGCASCHSGPQFTDSALHRVRAYDPLRKTPSLLGIGLRPPYMHDGCAETLEQRLIDEGCGGGDDHGQTSGLGEQGVKSLVAYLMTL
ncbi:MAG: hypothetical protein AAF602_06515 [Myxococcota bacterium]